MPVNIYCLQDFIVSHFIGWHIESIYQQDAQMRTSFVRLPYC